MSFGSKLKQYRIGKHLSQEQLANILGTTKQVASRYENEQRSPKLSIAVDIANKLNISLETLIDDNLEFKSELIGNVKRIPVLGKVVAGIPIEAIEFQKNNIPTFIDYQDKIFNLSKAIDMLTDESINAQDKNAFLCSFIKQINYYCTEKGNRWNEVPFSLEIIFK